MYASHTARHPVVRKISFASSSSQFAATWIRSRGVRHSIVWHVGPFLKQLSGFIFIYWHIPPKRWYAPSNTRMIQSRQRCRNLKHHTGATCSTYGREVALRVQNFNSFPCFSTLSLKQTAVHTISLRVSFKILINSLTPPPPPPPVYRLATRWAVWGLYLGRR